MDSYKSYCFFYCKLYPTYLTYLVAFCTQFTIKWCSYAYYMLGILYSFKISLTLRTPTACRYGRSARSCNFLLNNIDTVWIIKFAMMQTISSNLQKWTGHGANHLTGVARKFNTSPVSKHQKFINLRHLKNGTHMVT